MVERAVADAAHVQRLWETAWALFGHRWTLNGSAEARYHGNLNVRAEGLNAGQLISGLREVAISAGSACASGSGRPSHVLAALGLTQREANGSLRIGFGRYTSEEELAAALQSIDAAADAQRSFAA